MDTKTARRQFGRQLKAKREQRDLSLAEFARRVKVAKPTAWGWEAGNYSPSLGSLQRITAVLDCSAEDLLAKAS